MQLVKKKYSTNLTTTFKLALVPLLKLTLKFKTIVNMKNESSKQVLKEVLSKTDVISYFSFDEREPEIGAYISLVWEDGSDCECIYNGLDKSILPLPIHWYYVK